MTKNNKDFTRPTKEDLIYSGAKSAVSLLPFGIAIAPFLETLVIPPATRRRDEFIKSLQERVKLIEKK